MWGRTCDRSVSWPSRVVWWCRKMKQRRRWRHRRRQVCQVLLQLFTIISFWSYDGLILAGRSRRPQWWVCELNDNLNLNLYIEKQLHRWLIQRGYIINFVLNIHTYIHILKYEEKKWIQRKLEDSKSARALTQKSSNEINHFRLAPTQTNRPHQKWKVHRFRLHPPKLRGLPDGVLLIAQNNSIKETPQPTSLFHINARRATNLNNHFVLW